MPQKTVPLDLEPKKILLNNNTAKIKNSNPTILSAGSISKPSLRKDAVIFAPIEKSTLGTTQSTRRIGKTKNPLPLFLLFAGKRLHSREPVFPHPIPTVSDSLESPCLPPQFGLIFISDGDCICKSFQTNLPPRFVNFLDMGFVHGITLMALNKCRIIKQCQ